MIWLSGGEPRFARLIAQIGHQHVRPLRPSSSPAGRRASIRACVSAWVAVRGTGYCGIHDRAEGSHTPVAVASSIGSKILRARLTAVS